jgi:hypothetical protein
MADIQPFDLIGLLNQNRIEWDDQVGQLQFAGILMAVESKLNEVIRRVNRMDRNEEDPLG